MQRHTTTRPIDAEVIDFPLNTNPKSFKPQTLEEKIAHGMALQGYTSARFEGYLVFFRQNSGN